MKTIILRVARRNDRIPARQPVKKNIDMKPKDDTPKAEDILIEDQLPFDPENHDVSFDSDQELRLARNIVRAARSAKVSFDPVQKALIDQRITESIRQAKRKRFMAWMSSAAAVLLLAGLTTFYFTTGQSAIRKYALSADNLATKEYTTLVLSSQSEVRIVSQESQIEYSPDGKAIRIEAQNNRQQASVDDEAVFNTLIVPYGKRSRVTLPDNTVVWLNSGSKLTYPVKFTGEKREVYLDGEALFQVNRDENRPFFALTSKLDVKVLGTVFNLSAYSDDQTIKTVLESGLVELWFNPNLVGLKNKEQMMPGQLAVYDPVEKTIVQTKVNTKNFTSWKDGYVVFEKSTLGSIAKRLSRYYNVKIEFENQELANKTFSGNLDLRDSAVKVLELISEMIPIDLVSDDSGITIKNKDHS
ncbi:FecR family protein [Gaoshiqia sp. Z1-71]|uniref:FecR family protein n=1 Tax=Gaoshiqia hydrogeniformans TaxID=3290090 RepID=UPI003BF8D73B